MRYARALCLMGVLVGGLSMDSRGNWPTDPGAGLVVGAMEIAFSPRQSIAVGDDGGVWVAWQDSLCIGSVRLQRIGVDGGLLVVDGIEAQEDPTCAFHLPPVLTAVGNDVVMSRAGSSVSEYPVGRFGVDGGMVWPVGFSTESVRVLGGAVRLVNDDVLIVSTGFGSIYADRVDEMGESVWTEQALVIGGIASNMRIIDVVPMDDGGAIVFWDLPLSYTRLIFAMRINGDGTPVWTDPTQMVMPLPGIASSRHSDPVVVGDGQGGVVLVFTHGFESGTTPAPLLMQRVGADGLLLFPIEGVRVSLGNNRQFDVNVKADQATGDLIVAWRDGQFENMTVRVQRISLLGDRLWGDEGVEVGGLDLLIGSFDLVWRKDQLSVVIGGQSGVVMHDFDGAGQVVAGPLDVFTGGVADYVRAVEVGDGVVVSWQDDGFIAAQRVRADGTLGGASCSVADLTGDGSLNFLDVSAFLAAFGAQDPLADFSGDGSFNFLDVSAFLGAFGAGCP